MIQEINIGKSKLLTPKNVGIHVQEYHNYCLQVMSETLIRNGDEIALSLGDIGNYDANMPTLKFDAQYEHTLVKSEGRSVEQIIYGDTDLLYGEKGKYLVRIPNYNYYSGLDGTIEYSLPNMANIATNDEVKDYLDTATYVAATIYPDYDFNKENRVHTIALYSSNPSVNRNNFAKETQDCKIQYVNNAFSKKQLADLYNVSRIMVNVHQTMHHHTFEELRCLPALSRGVIIVSEDVPLKEKIPYHEHIVWARRDELANKLREVQNNYEDYHKQIFTDDLKNKLSLLHDSNINNFEGLYKKLRSKNGY